MKVNMTEQVDSMCQIKWRHFKAMASALVVKFPSGLSPSSSRVFQSGTTKLTWLLAKEGALYLSHTTGRSPTQSTHSNLISMSYREILDGEEFWMLKSFRCEQN